MILATSVIRFPLDTGRKLNVHKTFRKQPGRSLNILCMFNLRPVSKGYINFKHFKNYRWRIYLSGDLLVKVPSSHHIYNLWDYNISIVACKLRQKIEGKVPGGSWVMKISFLWRRKRSTTLSSRHKKVYSRVPVMRCIKIKNILKYDAKMAEQLQFYEYFPLPKCREQKVGDGELLCFIQILEMGCCFRSLSYTN